MLLWLHDQSSEDQRATFCDLTVGRRGSSVTRALDELELNDTQHLQTSYPAVDPVAGDLESIANRVGNNSEGLVALADTTDPPDSTLVVVLCVVLLRPLGYEDEATGWSGARGYLRDPAFLEALRTYRTETVQPRQVERVRALLGNHAGLGEDRVTDADRVVYDLFLWAQCVQSMFGRSDASNRPNRPEGYVPVPTSMINTIFAEK